MSDILKYANGKLLLHNIGRVLMSNDSYIISDTGLQKKHDRFGKLVTACCVIMIFILVLLGTLAIIM